MNVPSQESESGYPEFKAVKGAMRRKGIITPKDAGFNQEFSQLKSTPQVIQQSLQGTSPSGTGGLVRQYGQRGMKKEGMKRTASGFGVDRVYDIPYNPFRNRVAVETPTNRKELNARYRYYYRYEPLVGASIDAHTDIPLSNFKMVHEDKVLEQDCNDLIEQLDLFNFILQMVREYWMVGEAFPYGIFDNSENPTSWVKFILLDPDKTVVNAHPMAVGKSNSIQLILDETIRKIVLAGSRDPNTGSLYNHLSDDVKKYASAGIPMPLPDWQVSHFKRVGSPFNVRGESIISRVLHILAYRDKLRDCAYCLTEDAEVLTSDGFKKIPTVTIQDEVACFDPKTEEIKFLNPKETPSFDYDGDLYRFKTRKFDFETTSNHRMLVCDKSDIHHPDRSFRRSRSKSADGTPVESPWGNWRVIRADQVVPTDCFRTNGNWVGWENPPDSVEVAGKNVPLRDFLEFAGYYVSEGSTNSDPVALRGYTIGISQKPHTDSRLKMETCLKTLPFGFRCHEERYDIYTYGKELHHAVRYMFGADSATKRVPKWMKRLPPEYLEIFLRAVVLGDGSEIECKTGPDHVTYHTCSSQLSNDIQEMAWRAGYSSNKGKEHVNVSGSTMYPVYWSWDKRRGKISAVEQEKNITIRHYKGKVYCLTVPTEFFVIRQNGKIVIVGNTMAERAMTPKEFYMIGSEENPADEEELQNFSNLLSSTYLDPNQAIVWHHALKIEWLSNADKGSPVRAEFSALQEEMLNGLMIHKAMLSGEGPTYSTASVGIDIMMSRYQTLRNQVEYWIKKNVFEPIFKIHGIYKPSSAEVHHRIKVRKDRQPWLPNIKWDKYELRDNFRKIDTLVRLAEKSKLPWDAVYRALNFDPSYVTEKLQEEKRSSRSFQVPTPPPAGGMPPDMGEGGAPMPAPMPPGLPGFPGGEGGAETPEQVALPPIPAELMSPGGLPEVGPPAMLDLPTV
jgi:hypothetical protein